MDRLRKLWKRDPLGVLGVAASSVSGILFIAPSTFGYSWPLFFQLSLDNRFSVDFGLLVVGISVDSYSAGSDSPIELQLWGFQDWFIAWEYEQRLPAIIAFTVLALTLLLVRRR